MNWSGSGGPLTAEEINSCLEALSEMDKDEGVKEERMMVVVPGDVVRITNKHSMNYGEVGTVVDIGNDESVKVKFSTYGNVKQYYLDDIKIVREDYLKKEVDKMSDCQLYLMEKFKEYLNRTGSCVEGAYDFMSFVTGKSIYALEEEVLSEKGEN